MSGGAAVVEAVAAIARLQLPVKLVRSSARPRTCRAAARSSPGTSSRRRTGKTIEINNTDAEGRLVLADCLCHAVSLGAERIVDLATLTGAVIVALGSTYAGLMSNDEELTEQCHRRRRAHGRDRLAPAAARRVRELVAGKYGDLDNAPEARKAGTIMGASFLSELRRGHARGRTSTSPAPPGISAAPTWARARRATACGCWSSSRAPTARLRLANP